MTGCLKNDVRNLLNFFGNSRKSENLHFNGLFSPIAYKVSAKKVQKSISYDTDERSKLWRKTNFFFLKNEMKSLVNFNMSSGESHNLHFHGLLVSKVSNFWAKKVRRSCVLKNELWFQKWHKEFGEQIVESKVDKSFVYNALAEGM